jgi:ArsR family transcriptional regulator, arsenate/arsenite/antimonite-responsive transcriptional repressor
MSINKKEEFADELNYLADIAKAISHPARLAILVEVAKRKECICGEIVEVLPLAQSTVSQHLKELKDVELIKGTVEGTKSCYCINWSKINEFKTLINNFLQGEVMNCC